MRDVDLPRRGGGLAIYEERLAPLTAPLGVGMRIPTRDFKSVPHVPGAVGVAAEIRDRHLADFAPADASRFALGAMSRTPLERRVALRMVGVLLELLGVKDDPVALAAMVHLLEADGLARASRLWKPINVSPAALALAATKLIASQVFALKAAELAEACREAVKTMRKAEAACEALVDYVRKADAVLLAFAPDQWRVPWLMPEFRPILPRMLELHEIYGDGSESFDWGRPSAFGAAVERVRAELAPELIEGSAEEAAMPKARPGRRITKPKADPEESFDD